MSRPALVLLPGLGCDRALWAGQVRDLADIADMQVGDTLHDDSIAAIAARVLAAAPDRFALAGLSMGGYIAMEIMRIAPDRVTRLALLDTSARPDTPEQTAGRRAAIAAIGTRDYRDTARDSLPGLIAAQAPPAVRDAVTEMIVRVGPEAYVRQQTLIPHRPDSRPSLGAIAVPTAVIVGALDTLTPPDLSREMAALIPDARLHLVAGSGHLSTMEQPGAVSAILRKWLVD